MAVHIRLRRMGAMKRPFYRIVAADSRTARNGAFLDIIGTYNPITKPATVEIEETKMTEWLSNGAVPSDTVRTLLKQVGFSLKARRAEKGEDVSGMALNKPIKERPKKTRHMKKASATAETK